MVEMVSMPTRGNMIFAFRKGSVMKEKNFLALDQSIIRAQTVQNISKEKHHLHSQTVGVKVHAQWKSHLENCQKLSRTRYLDHQYEAVGPKYRST